MGRHRAAEGYEGVPALQKDGGNFAMWETALRYYAHAGYALNILQGILTRPELPTLDEWIEEPGPLGYPEDATDVDKKKLRATRKEEDLYRDKQNACI